MGGVGSGRKAEWTEEKIIAAIRRYAEEFGEPPSMNDWKPPPPGYPSCPTVQRYFGSFGRAKMKAGFPQRKPHGKRKQFSFDGSYRIY